MSAFSSLTDRVSGFRSAASAPSDRGQARLELSRDGQTTDTRTLGNGEYRIGARSDCDIVVPDAPAAHFALLKVDGAGAGGTTMILVPFLPGMVADGLAAAPFVPLEIRKATTITIGGTTLHCAPARTASLAERTAKAVATAKAQAESAPRPSFRLPALDPRKMLLAAGLLFGAAFVSSFLDTSSLPFGLGGGSGIQATATDAKVADAGEMVTLIRRQLTIADLGDTIAPRLDGKTIVIEGSVSDRQEDRYRGLLAGFRRRSPVELRSQVQPVAMPAQSQIAGVALSPVALVVLQDGGRFRVGETMPVGWKVEAITDQGVSLSRDALRVTVPLGGR